MLVCWYHSSHWKTSLAVHMKDTIRDLLRTQLREGDKWYLISTTWFRKWKKYVGCINTISMGKPSAKPGPIDNSSLFEEGSEALKENLVDEQEYVLVPEEAWTKLVSWYGLAEGQKPILRHVIKQGSFIDRLKVEVYLMNLKMCRYQQMDAICSQMFSHANTIRDIEQEMRSVFQIAASKPVRLWEKDKSNTFEELDIPDNTLSDILLHPDHVLVIEEQTDGGTWPRTGK